MFAWLEKFEKDVEELLPDVKKVEAAELVRLKAAAAKVEAFIKELEAKV